MKIRDLIEQLQKLENKDANVNILMGNESGEFSAWDIEIFQDKTADGYIEIHADLNTARYEDL